MIVQGDDDATHCFLDYPYFKNYFMMIATTQNTLDDDPIKFLNKFLL